MSSPLSSRAFDLCSRIAWWSHIDRAPKAATRAELRAPAAEYPRGAKPISARMLAHRCSAGQSTFEMHPSAASVRSYGPAIRVATTLISIKPLPVRIFPSEESIKISGPKGQFTVTVRPAQVQVPLFPVVADEVPSAFNTTTAELFSHFHDQAPATPAH